MHSLFSETQESGSPASSSLRIQKPSAQPYGALSFPGPAGWLPGPHVCPCGSEHGFLVRGHWAQLFISFGPLAKEGSALSRR